MLATRWQADVVRPRGLAPTIARALLGIEQHAGDRPAPAGLRPTASVLMVAPRSSRRQSDRSPRPNGHRAGADWHGKTDRRLSGCETAFLQRVSCFVVARMAPGPLHLESAAFASKAAGATSSASRHLRSCSAREAERIGVRHPPSATQCAGQTLAAVTI